MPSKKVQVTASPSVKSLLPTAKVALLELKAPPELDDGGRGGPSQEDWACEDGGADQCNDKVGCTGVPSGFGCRP
jgi:hypothetical protein